MINKIFGKWTVLSKSSRLNISRQAYYLCRCECGDEIEVVGASLRSGKSSACQRCCRQNFQVKVGDNCGDWLILQRSEKKSKSGHLYYLCRCKCGEEKDIRADALRNKQSNQCLKCAAVNSIEHMGCKFCYCKTHQNIDLEASECDLLGFCARCDKFDLADFLAFEYARP